MWQGRGHGRPARVCSLSAEELSGGTSSVMSAVPLSRRHAHPIRPTDGLHIRAGCPCPLLLLKETPPLNRHGTSPNPTPGDRPPPRLPPGHRQPDSAGGCSGPRGHQKRHPGKHPIPRSSSQGGGLQVSLNSTSSTNLLRDCFLRWMVGWREDPRCLLPPK